MTARPPQTAFLPEEPEDATASPTWWERRTYRQKWAVVVTGIVAALFAIGSVNQDDAAGANLGAGATASPSSPPSSSSTPRATPMPTASPDPTPIHSPTDPPTATPAPMLGRAPIGATTTALVVDVVDGDTIKVQVDGGVYSVRYIGIDTPETVHPSVPVQWMGPEASAANADLVAGRQVVLEKDVSETDRYSRLLRYVWIEQSGGWLLVNLELVRRGFASSSTYPPDVAYQDLFLAAQREARNAGAGLWASTPAPAATPPPAAAGNCDLSYPDVCIPPYPPDLDCGDIEFRRFTVRQPDLHGFDGDGDGIGCES